MVNIVESVCQDPGRPALAEQETHSQNIVPSWEMRPGNTVVPDANKVILSYINTLICISMNTTGTGD